MFELKWKPKEDESSSEEEPPKKPSAEEVVKLVSIVENEQMEPKDWFRALLIDNRDLFFKWMDA